MIDLFFVHELLMITRKRTIYIYLHMYVCMYIHTYSPTYSVHTIETDPVIYHTPYISIKPTNQPKSFKKKKEKERKRKKKKKKEIPKPARGIAGIGPCPVIGPSNYVCVCMYSILELHMYVMYVCTSPHLALPRIRIRTAVFASHRPLTHRGAGANNDDVHIDS